MNLQARIKAVNEDFQLNERDVRELLRTVPGRMHSLSIIGSQGSGKSTLMNSLVWSGLIMHVFREQQPF